MKVAREGLRFILPSVVLTVLFGILGLGAYRSYEKVKKNGG